MKIKSPLTISKIHRSECHKAKGLAVVIDVIRAFTTASYAFAAGAEQIIAVGEVEQARLIHNQNNDFLLMGEKDGWPIEGFHYGNSPSEISVQDLLGKTLVQRTSSGTQGVVGCAHLDQILTTSFVIANSTLERIRALNPEHVTFVITGTKNGGFEDKALADYLEACLIKDRRIDPTPYLQQVVDSKCAHVCFERYGEIFRNDLEKILAIDTFPFCIQVIKEQGLLVQKPFYHSDSTL